MEGLSWWSLLGLGLGVALLVCVVLAVLLVAAGYFWERFGPGPNSPRRR